MTRTELADATRFEDAAVARWLSERLAPARARVREQPTDDALERIRLRVFGATSGKRERSIAA